MLDETNSVNIFSFIILNASAQIDCGFQPDADGNYVIGVTDVLALLELFGQADSDMDGIWDGSDICIDVEACNYDANHFRRMSLPRRSWGMWR